MYLCGASTNLVSELTNVFVQAWWNGQQAAKNNKLILLVREMWWSFDHCLFVPSCRAPSWRFSDMSILLSRNRSPSKTHLLRMLCRGNAALREQLKPYSTPRSANLPRNPGLLNTSCLCLRWKEVSNCFKFDSCNYPPRTKISNHN